MTLSGRGIDQGQADPIRIDNGLWAGFASAGDAQTFLTSWLVLLVGRVGRADQGAVFELDAERSAFVPVAVVPDPRTDVSGLGPVVEQVLSTGRPARLSADEGDGQSIAYPVSLPAGPIQSVIALRLDAAGEADTQSAMRELHWAAGWLKARALEEMGKAQTGQLSRAAVALDLLALAGEHTRPEPAGMAVANELQKVLKCDRVAIGMLVKRRTAPAIRMLAMSYSAVFKKRSALVEMLEGVMEEAFDQSAAVSWPALTSTRRAISVAHSDLVKQTRSTAIMTAPLTDGNAAIGAIAAERRQGDPFTEDDLALLQSVAALLGPVLELKRKNHRWIGGRIWDGVAHGLGVVLGPRRLSWKLLVIALVALAIAAATLRAPFRVQADAVLRGEEQRAAVAPFNGFLDAAPVRAGDRVAQGDLLAALDDTDLRLEELRWSAEIDRLNAQLREALATGERTQAAFLDAQIAQARAQLDLTRAELTRTQITAPIDGIVVAGDLTQRLGAPLQTGEVLFEIAPLDSFRVDIYVDERDLPHVTDDATGRLALAGQPTDGLPFAITRITPVSEAREGVNTFRTEARLDVAPNALTELRPGMQGVAKIDAGEALVVWTWTRRLRDWLRKTAWTWQP